MKIDIKQTLADAWREELIAISEAKIVGEGELDVELRHNMHVMFYRGFRQALNLSAALYNLGNAELMANVLNSRIQEANVFFTEDHMTMLVAKAKADLRVQETRRQEEHDRRIAEILESLTNGIQHIAKEPK